jgi:uncharacterized protein (TIGR03083 family)
MAGSVESAVAALERTAARFTRLLRSDIDGTQRVKGLSWTIRDLAAHLASGSVAYGQVAEGRPSPYETLDGRRETNQQRLEDESGDDLGALADVIDDEVARLLATVRSGSNDGVVAWHGGISMSLPAFLGAAVGEFLVHGRDLARTLGQPWPIKRADAQPVVDFFNAVAPFIVDADRSKGRDATFEVRFRGHETSSFVFQNGKLSVTEGPSRRAHVHMSLDPVAFLLVGYKRIGLTVPIITGRALAWGRRPWLALRFPGLFETP